MYARGLIATIVFMVLSICVVATPIMAITYTVGDANGWSLGVDYTTWASTKTFNVGDSLVFNYGMSHSVSEVTSAEYISCSLSNALSVDRSGATTITLKTPGVHYFVCGAPGHCGAGQKLAVTVSHADVDTVSPTAAPPSGNTNNNDVAPTSAIVPDSSSATTLTPIAAVLLMACGLVVSKFIV